mgnify:CR=1 FL=1
MEVVLVHGVGIGADGFATVARCLAADGASSTVPARRGYDGRPPCPDLAVHVRDLLTHVTADTDVIAGVSGGATIALATAVTLARVATAAGDRADDSTEVSFVVHEPLVGPLAAAQHRVVTASIARLHDRAGSGAADEMAAVADFVAGLVGDDTFGGLSADVRDRALAAAPTIGHETRGFARFELEHGDLAAAAPTVTWTVGADSPPWRHEAAAVAASAGIRVETVPGGHSPHLDHPGAWAAVVRSASCRPATERPVSTS